MTTILLLSTLAMSNVNLSLKTPHTFNQGVPFTATLNVVPVDDPIQFDQMYARILFDTTMVSFQGFDPVATWRLAVKDKDPGSIWFEGYTTGVSTAPFVFNLTFMPLKSTNWNTFFLMGTDSEVYFGSKEILNNVYPTTVSMPEPISCLLFSLFGGMMLPKRRTNGRHKQIKS